MTDLGERMQMAIEELTGSYVIVTKRLQWWEVTWQHSDDERRWRTDLSPEAAIFRALVTVMLDLAPGGTFPETPTTLLPTWEDTAEVYLGFVPWLQAQLVAQALGGKA